MVDAVAVKRNLELMRSKGATPEEMDAYVQGYGLTPEDIRNAGKSTIGAALDDTGQWISDTDKGLTEFQQGLRRQVTGPEKGTRDIPEFPAPGGGNVRGNPGAPGIQVGDLGTRGFNDAALFTDNDKDYGAVITKGLKDLGRYVGTEKDPNGYDIITYKGDDGKEYVAYVNAPGLTMSDVNRELAGALPAAISGFGTSALAKKLGLGTLGRTVGVGLAEAGTQLAKDVGAAYKGAEPNPVDTSIKALAAGGGGALFEGLSGPISRGWRKLFTQKFPVVDASGKLTPAAIQAAKASGLDPDEMNERMAVALRDKSVNAADPNEVGVDVRTGEFGIPTTKGQRTKDPSQLGREKDLSRGVYGKEAADIIGTPTGPKKTGFYGEQQSAIDRAVNNSVGMSLAPKQGGHEAATLGTRIKSGVQGAEGAYGEVENQLWGELGPLHPTGDAFDTLPQALMAKLDDAGVRPDPSLPASHRAMTIIDDFREGKMTLPPYKVLGESKKAPPVPTIRDVQKRLLAEYMGASDPTDARAAKAVYDGFNDWISDIAERGAVNDPEGAAALWVMRAFTREKKSLFNPEGPAGNILETVLSKNNTPEDVLGALLGRGGPSTTPPKGAVEALTNIKTTLGRAGKDTWDDIRLANWVKMTQDKQGVTLSPLQLKKNIDAAFVNQKTLLDTLYTPEEQKTMRRLARALDDVISVDPNPSGTAHELARMSRESGPRGLTKTFLQTQSKRELFSKHNVLMSRMYALLAKKLTIDPLGARTGMGASVARRATSPALTPKGGSSFLAPAGSIGALEFADDMYPEEVE